MENEETRIREWINTLIALLVLIVIVFGLFQIIEVNLNLNEIKANIGKFDTVFIANSTISAYNATCDGFWRSDWGGKILTCID